MSAIQLPGAVLNFVQSSPMVGRLALMLAHSLWQGVAAAMLLYLVLLPTRRLPGAAWSNFRYLCACCAMLAVVAAAAATFVLSDSPKIPSAGSSIGALPTAVLVSTALPQASPENPRGAWMLPAVVVSWIAGVAFLSVWQFAGWMRIQSWRRERPLDELRWARALTDLTSRMGVRRMVKLVGSMRVDVPMVLGAIRPVIVVPLALATELSFEQVEAIIAHELAHVRRHDYLVNLIQAAVETVFFHHPAVWWISAQIRTERENCCDDIAAAACGGNLAYARALVVLEERRGAGIRFAPGAGDGNLLRRVKRLAAASARRPARGTNLAFILLLAAAALVASMSVAHPRRALAQAVPQISDPPTTLPSGATVRKIHVTIGKDSFMSVEGGVGSWGSVRQEILKLPADERPGVVICVAAEFGDVPVSEFFEAMGRAQELVDQLKLAYVSDTGVDPTSQPLSGEVYVGGIMQRTGPYSITDRHVSLRQMLISAGGVEGNVPAWISIIRRSADGDTRPMTNVSYNDLMEGRAIDLYLQRNDIVMVSSNRKPDGN